MKKKPQRAKGTTFPLVLNGVPHCTFGGFSAKWVFEAAGCNLAPSVLHSRLGNYPVVEALLRPEVIPQVFHRLDVVLLFRGKYGIERFQLNVANQHEGKEEGRGEGGALIRKKNPMWQNLGS